MENPTHRPSGIMCHACNRRDENCAVFDFTRMQKIKADKDGVVVVRCSEFKRQNIPSSESEA